LQLRACAVLSALVLHCKQRVGAFNAQALANTACAFVARYCSCGRCSGTAPKVATGGGRGRAVLENALTGEAAQLLKQASALELALRVCTTAQGCTPDPLLGRLRAAARARSIALSQGKAAVTLDRFQPESPTLSTRWASRTGPERVAQGFCGPLDGSWQGWHQASWSLAIRHHYRWRMATSLFGFEEVARAAEVRGFRSGGGEGHALFGGEGGVGLRWRLCGASRALSRRARRLRMQKRFSWRSTPDAVWLALLRRVDAAADHPVRGSPGKASRGCRGQVRRMRRPPRYANENTANRSLCSSRADRCFLHPGEAVVAGRSPVCAPVAAHPVCF
jgi:hypothetical protein